MSAITCTRRLCFEAGHRVYGHESKCANLHGHSYKVEVTAESIRPWGLDDVGRVVDFSVLKEKIGGWINEHWDHSFLYFIEDDECLAFFTRNSRLKAFALLINPTAENLAHYILEIIAPQVLLNVSIRVTHVRVYETENCYADAWLCEGKH